MEGWKNDQINININNNFKNMIFCKTGKVELSLKAKKSNRVKH